MRERISVKEAVRLYRILRSWRAVANRVVGAPALATATGQSPASRRGFIALDRLPITGTLRP